MPARNHSPATGGVTLPEGSELHVDKNQIEWARIASPVTIGELTVPAGSELEFDGDRPGRCDLHAPVVWRGKRYKKGETIELTDL